MLADACLAFVSSLSSSLSSAYEYSWIGGLISMFEVDRLKTFGSLPFLLDMLDSHDGKALDCQATQAKISRRQE